MAFARIGYSQTGGEDIDDTGACRTKRYFEPYESAVNQTLQVLAAMRERPDVAQDRGIIIGQSYGGSTATGLAARNPSGIQAMINFAGGGGGNPDTSPRNPCRADLLKKLFADYGKTARVPMLFAYTENDLYWGAEHPKDWFGVFKSSGGVGQFIQFPPEGKDGHSLFYRAPQIWRPRVAEFLRVNGFPEIKP